MAEFTEVIRQGSRMCKAYVDCNRCPLGGAPFIKLSRCPFAVFNDTEQETVEACERAVMGWAQDNPEPQYPCWGEAWQTLFPDNSMMRPPCPKWFMGHEETTKYCQHDCFECAQRPIPADIAEKLHIRPIGDGSHG